MKILLGESGVLLTDGATSGTLANAAISPTSTVTMSLQRDTGEDISPLYVTLVGPPRAGEQDWEINQGHDNPVKLHYVIVNND